MTYDDWKARDEIRERGEEPTFWCDACRHGAMTEADSCGCPCCNPSSEEEAAPEPVTEAQFAEALRRVHDEKDGPAQCVLCGCAGYHLKACPRA